MENNICLSLHCQQLEPYGDDVDMNRNHTTPFGNIRQNTVFSPKQLPILNILSIVENNLFNDSFARFSFNIT